MLSALQTLDQPGRLWLIKVARENYWRVCSHIDLDDLIQDGYLHYQRVVTKYPQVDSRPHLMRLFQRTYLNHLHNLAKRRTRERAIEVPTTDPPQSPDELLLLLIAKAPPAVRAFLRGIATEPGIRHLRAPNRLYRDRTRQTFNDNSGRPVFILDSGEVIREIV